MKIRIILLSALLALFPLGASAQRFEVQYDDNWFVGVGAGLNLGVDGQIYQERDYSHTGSGLALDVYAGRFFNRWLGFRAGYHGLNTSNHYTQFGRDRFVYVHADALFRLGSVFVPYAHAGMGYLTRLTPAGGLGLMLPMRLTGRVSLVPDFKATLMNSAGFEDGTPRLGYNFSVTLGLQIKLGEI